MRILSSFTLLAFTTAAFAVPTDKDLQATHRQTDVLKPAHGPSAVTMHTFVLNDAGDLVTAISPQARYNSKPVPGAPRGWIQTYSADKQLKKEIELPFPPQAIALTKDGGYYAAGEGEVGRFDADGKVITRTTVLKILNLDEAKLRTEVIAQMKEDQQRYAESQKNQIASIERQVVRLEESLKTNKNPRDVMRLSSLKSMIKMLSDQEEVSESRITSMMQHRLRTPSIALAGDDLLITLYLNRGYEVWRTTASFEKPRKVIGGLRGCCGQMDIITSGDKILTAENTKFQVGFYDLEGTKLTSFGKRHSDDANGFGSCCNPMNVLCCPNGDIVTAESSIGHIKRFNDKGEIQAVIGRARIGGGCKHVALGHDKQRDRYYVQYQDMNHICIMLPNAEAAPLVAELDRKLKAAEDAALKLVGRWTEVTSPGAAPAAAPTDDPYEYTPEPRFSGFTFKEDHSLELELATKRSGTANFRRWYASSMEAGAIQFEIEEDDGYVDFATQVTLVDANTLEMKLSTGTKTFKRS
jgi:hypothetical protein